MTKLERRKQRLERHYQTLEKLALFFGVNAPNGKKLSVALLKLEREAHKAAEDYCNGEIDLEKWDIVVDTITRRVKTLFNGFTGGFFINGDPRGYALKVDEYTQKRLALEGIELERDWGGYGLLSPEITGD